MLAFCITSPASAQDDEDSPYRPGLVATYSSAGQTITRTDETIAFDWQAAAPDPRLPAGHFTATWKGRLWARGAGQYHLLAYVNGEVTLKLAGKAIIEGKSNAASSSEPKWLESQPLDLDFDHHPLEVTYIRTSKQGQLALFWSGPDFRLEPIPAWALLHDKADSPSNAFERGRQLACALRCAACHKDTTTTITPAPALDRLSGNIHEQWLIGWLASTDDNKGISAARRMPHLNITHDEATAVAAWLLREPPVKTEPKKFEQKETKVTKEDSKKSDTKSKKSKGEEKPKPSAEEGEKLLLTRGCLACHQLDTNGLSGLFGGGHLSVFDRKRPPEFLARWLADPSAINHNHRMPVFQFTADEFTSLNLWAERQWKQSSPRSLDRLPRSPDLVPQGEKLVASFKCAACHSLSREKDKNTTPAADQKELTAASNWKNSCAGQFDRSKNKPGYQLSAEDAEALKTYYSTPTPGATQLSQQARGRDSLTQLNCLACHQREGVDRTALVPLRPGPTAKPDPNEIQVSSPPPEPFPTSLPPLQDKLPPLAESHPTLAPLIPAMTPPALNSVGDKLHDKALEESIVRKGRPHRPYLLVQMPKFELSKDQLAALTAYFTSTDRIPSRPPQSGPLAPRVDKTASQTNPPSSPATVAPPAPGNSRSELPTLAALAAAGPRLVTTDGLACTSCHQVGSVLPTKAPLNARGPDMSMLGSRIRREWFDRWCNNPARIVPRMEMPAVKIPVRGVLSDNVEDQLAAVWHILNTPGFQPPEPDPVRVLRLSGLPEQNERPLVIHDVFKDGDKTYLFPLVIGLPNRHNILFDLETNRLAAWWLGDTARQRTKGKSWYWEMGGKSIDLGGPEGPSPVLVQGSTKINPEPEGQFATQFSGYTTSRQGDSSIVGIFSGLRFPKVDLPNYAKEASIWEIISCSEKTGNGFDRVFRVYSLPPGSQVQLRVVSDSVAKASTWNAATSTLMLAGSSASIALKSDRPFEWMGDGTVVLAKTQAGGQPSLTLEYRTTLPADQFLSPILPSHSVKEASIVVAPGFTGTRLGLPGEIMPTGLAWHPNNSLIFPTLKGEVFAAQDSDGNGTEDSVQLLADGLPTPYGVAIPAGRVDRIDLAVKTGLTRLQFSNRDPFLTVRNAFSAWGRTDDYHDWAVGPVPGDKGQYFIALPCQQDQRSEAAAQYRGKIVKLTPRKIETESRKFDIEIISAGHRFPMGMARNRDGELFVTDNQGNYNPFNELNHVKSGAHFGFINALEKEKGFTPPPLTEPAINIPHPWTRSVNGICFLETPDALRSVGSAHQDSPTNPPSPTSPSTPSPEPRAPRSLFGPLEGHLVGCEYDTRRLIRMSLDKVNGEYQGCCYPLSIPPADVEKGLLGPIVCAVKPTTGELYVGEIRDSGWGASNNIGQIVKIKIEPEKLPCGIAEVKATQNGFTIDFFRPVDKTKAADVTSYSLESYRRESTPAYGGPDLDRRPEKITKVELSPDAKRITLTVEGLRPRHVYEFRLKNLTPGSGTFHPDEAHYTLKQIPNDK